MKKYYFRSEVYDGHAYALEAIAGEGDWEKWDDVLYVKAEDAEKLQQLNKKMLEVLASLVTWNETEHLNDDRITTLKFHAIIERAEFIIKEAELEERKLDEQEKKQSLTTI